MAFVPIEVEVTRRRPDLPPLLFSKRRESDGALGDAAIGMHLRIEQRGTRLEVTGAHRRRELIQPFIERLHTASLTPTSVGTSDCGSAVPNIAARTRARVA